MDKTSGCISKSQCWYVLIYVLEFKGLISLGQRFSKTIPRRESGGHKKALEQVYVFRKPPIIILDDGVWKALSPRLGFVSLLDNARGIARRKRNRSCISTYIFKKTSSAVRNVLPPGSYIHYYTQI